MKAHIYSIIVPFIVKNTIRDKYTKNCFSDGVKLRLNLLKECVSKRLGPFLAVCIRQDLFLYNPICNFAPTRNVYYAGGLYFLLQYEGCSAC